MKNLKIYLADLTYNTTVIANDVFPLNIGLIASYCKKRFGNDVEIFLFKFIDELEQELYRSPPDIIGVSNYAWCKEISLHMLRLTKTLSPSTLTVMGGPNFPLDLQSQKKFMKKYTEVDIYVPIDGEEGFSNIVDCVLKNAHSKDEIQEKVLAEPIEGCISRDQYDELQFTIPVIRIKNLDEIPSPYQTGLLDQFFSKKLSPIFQSNRGCPFTCTFCVDGTDQVQKINQFSLERVKGDLEYIASHVPKNIHSLYISDLNFGMYPRDLDICKEIAEKQKKYGYPLSILCNTGKNKKERNIEAVKQLNGALNLFLSVQSLDEQVLQNIRRSNISTEQMIELVPTIKKEKLRTSSEIILGLPGDSYESHLKTIRDLLKADVDDLHMYTCMLLDGSELGSPKERQKWDLKTKFRILPKDFVKLSDGKVIVEIEEVVIETDKLTFEEYLELRLLAFIITVMKKNPVFDPVIKFLKEKNIDTLELFFNIISRKNEASIKFQNIFNKFKQATKDELYDSPEEIKQLVQNDETYQKLLNGELGMNLLYHFNGVVILDQMREWIEYSLKITHDILIKNGLFDEEVKQEFDDIQKYCLNSIYVILKDEALPNQTVEFNYDIPKWLSETNHPLKKFKFECKKIGSFEFSQEDIQIHKDELSLRDNSRVAKIQAIARIPAPRLFRKLHF